MQTRAYNPAVPAESPAASWSVPLILGGLMAFVCVLAFFVFGQSGLRLDEAQSLWQSGRSAADILILIAQDVHVPLYHELLHAWRLLIGDTVEAGRLLSLIFYVLSIPAMYALGALAYSRNAGLYGALLLSISPFMNWYGSEIRMYTLFTLLVILNQYCFIRIWKRHSAADTGPDDAAARERVWVGYILTGLLGIFTHYFFFLTLAAQAAFYFLRKSIFPPEAWRRFFFSWGFLALCFLPWAAFVFFQSQASNAAPALAPPTTINLFSAFSQFIFGFHDDHLNTIFLSLWPLTIVLGFLALRKTTRMEPQTEYFMLSVLIAVSLAFFGSLLLAPVFVSRYLIFTVPALFLLLGALFSLYPPRATLLAKSALAGLMLLMLSIEILSPTTPVKENYREAANYLTDNAAAQDVVILSAPFTIYPVEYYYRGAAPVHTLPIWDRYASGAIPPFNENALPEEVETLTRDHQYAWMLFSYDQGYEDTVRAYMEQNYERVAERTFSPGLDLVVYKIRYDTPLSHSPPTFSTVQ